MTDPRNMQVAIARARNQCARHAEHGKFRGIYIWRAHDGRLHTTAAVPKRAGYLLMIVTMDETVIWGEK